MAEWVHIEDLYDDDDFVPSVDIHGVTDERELDDFRPDFHTWAMCRDIPQSVFFGTDDADVRPTMTTIQVARARKICHTCPVFGECLEWALTNREEYGVWAGTSGRTRERLWARIDAGEITILEIVTDYCNGNSILHERGSKAA